MVVKGLQGSLSRSSLSSSHKFRKLRTQTGGPSTSLVWKPKMPTTFTSMTCQPEVPASWEKRYCEEEGLIPWKQIVEAYLLKETTHKKFFDWDASSGEEALAKAKARFWRKLNGLPFEPLTSEEYADTYVDKIDWNAQIDPDVYLALDKRDGEDINDRGNHGDDDDKPKWLTDEYLNYKAMPVKLTTQGWGTEFNDQEDA